MNQLSRSPGSAIFLFVTHLLAVDIFLATIIVTSYLKNACGFFFHKDEES